MQQTTPQPSATNREILIVDNDSRIVELVAWFLTKRGYDVRSAGSFAEARGLLDGWRPDLMLSDIDLGAENALDELPRLDAEGCLPPTLVVSGFLDAESTARLQSLEPVLGTLPKPFDFHVLEQRMGELLAAPRRSSGAPVPAAISANAPSGGEEHWVEITPTPRSLPTDSAAGQRPGSTTPRAATTSTRLA